MKMFLTLFFLDLTVRKVSHLLHSKENSHRLKDQLDAQELRKIKYLTT